MTNINLSGVYTNGQVADADDVQADFDAVETFLNTTGVHVYQAGTVIEAALATSAVTAGKIAANAVTTAKIADSNVTTAKIADSNVTTAKIADDNVTTAKIAAGAITAAKIAAGAVTHALLGDLSVAPRNIARVASAHTSNINTSNPGTSTLGGTTAVSGEVVLLVAQSTASQNGPWTFNGSGSAMTRPVWYDGSGDGFEGFSVECVRGTFQGQVWRLATSGAITIDTTSTSWHMAGFMGSGNTASRPTISYVASGGMYIDTEAGIVYYSDSGSWTALPIASGSVADGAITTNKLADGSVTDEKIADDAVGPRQTVRISSVHSSGNVNTSNPGTSTLGGTTVVDNVGEGEFVLLVAQSAASQNGPWQFNGSGAALTRPSWYDSSGDGFEGMSFDVARGDWSNTRWRLTTSGAITVGSTSTSWQAVGYVGRGATGSKPSASLIGSGGLYFDTTLGQLQRSDGSSWTELIDITDLTDHISDATGAHAATAISYAGDTGLSATTVEAALDEINQDVIAHVGDATAAHAASAISFTPASGIAATDVQAAIVEAIADWQANFDDMNIGKIFDFGGPVSQIPAKHVAAFGQALNRTTYASLFAVYCPIVSSTATATASNDRITATAHGLAVGDAVFIESIGAGAAGLSANTMYYVATVVDANNITVGTGRSVTASTGAASVTGSPVNISSDGSTIVLRHAPHGVSGASTFLVPDLRKVSTIGLGNMGGSDRGVSGHAWANIIGTFAGEAAHALSAAETASKAHEHNFYDVSSAAGAHTHGQNAATKVVTNTTATGGDPAGSSYYLGNGADAWSNAGDHTHEVSGTTTGGPSDASGSSHNNIQPGMMVAKIIYAGA